VATAGTSQRKDARLAMLYRVRGIGTAIMSRQNSVEAIKVGEKGIRQNLIAYRVDNLP
jgi:hypothetical protein